MEKKKTTRKKTTAHPRAKTKKSNVTKVKTVKHKKSTVKKTGAKKASTKVRKFKTATNKNGDQVWMSPDGKIIMIETHRSLI